MTTRRPLVIVAGQVSQLPSGDVLSLGGGVFPPNFVKPMTNPNSSGGGSVVGARAYFMYVGQLGQDVTVTQAIFSVQSGASGTQVAELALYSSPSGPTATTQDLTRIGAGTSSLPVLTTTGAKSVTLNQSVAADTHLWVAFRCDFGAGTNPAIYRALPDIGLHGLHLYGTPGDLTAASSVSAASLTFPNHNVVGLAINVVMS